MRDSIQGLESQQTMAQAEAKFLYEKQKAIDEVNTENTLALKEEEKKKQTLLLYVVLISAIILAFFLIFIFNRLKITRKQKIIIETQKGEVDHAFKVLEEKNNEITDSIVYAKRIQMAILPPKETVKSFFPESFIFFRPKDIVAGDFYWMESTADKKFLPLQIAQDMVFLEL